MRWKPDDLDARRSMDWPVLRTSIADKGGGIPVGKSGRRGVPPHPPPPPPSLFPGVRGRPSQGLDAGACRQTHLLASYPRVFALL